MSTKQYIESDLRFFEQYGAIKKEKTLLIHEGSIITQKIDDKHLLKDGMIISRDSNDKEKDQFEIMKEVLRDTTLTKANSEVAERLEKYGLCLEKNTERVVLDYNEKSSSVEVDEHIDIYKVVEMEPKEKERVGELRKMMDNIDCLKDSNLLRDELQREFKSFDYNPCLRKMDDILSKSDIILKNNFENTKHDFVKYDDFLKHELGDKSVKFYDLLEKNHEYIQER